MFGAIYAAEGSDGAVLEGVAREFSPRIEVFDKREIALDLNGVARLFGNGREIAAAIRTTAADRGLRVRVAIADTRTAARLLVHHRAGITVIAPGTEAEVLAPLPLTLLRTLRALRPNDSNDSNDSNDPNASNGSNDLVLTLRRWGLRTLGEFAALPADAVAARLGQEGVWWQRVAAGEDPLPLVPSVPEERFEQALELEWPIDGLEPLSFVLGRLMEPLERHLEQRDRGAAVLHVRLYLVKGAGDRGAGDKGAGDRGQGDKEAGETENGTRRVHERTLQLPTPIRDARTLRTLALLDLESHPPSAAIDRVVVAVDPTPGRIVQYSLLTRPLPSPEQISTLMARLNALMGDGRCGAPAIVDSWRPGAFAMGAFNPKDATPGSHEQQPRRHGDTEVAFQSCIASPGADTGLSASVPQRVKTGETMTPIVALRRFRLPIPARVHVEQGKPSRLTTDRRGLSGGRVEQCAGPWRTSGAWWTGEGRLEDARPSANSQWDRDEWDVTLNDGATYRVFRERDSDHWFLEGIVD